MDCFSYCLMKKSNFNIRIARRKHAQMFGNLTWFGKMLYVFIENITL